jgi:hypothetical protein
VTTYYNNAVTALLGTVSLGGSAHHGVQSDFLLGKNSAGYISATLMTNGYKVAAAAPTFAQSHYGSGFKATSTGTNDSCVICHVTSNTQNTTGQVTSHGMYLTGATGDNVAVCAVCHVTGGTATHQTTSGTAFKTFVSGHNYLADIDTAKKTLLGFFGNPAFFYALSANGGATAGDAIVIGPAFGAANGAVQGCTTVAGATTPTTGQYTPGATWAWKKDWDFTSPSAYMTVNEMQALWNFKLFAEDRSDGIHNPQYAAQLLFDAITLINADTGAGVAGTSAFTTAYPTGLPNPWGARP